MSRITTMEEFRAAKEAILNKYGDAIIMGDATQTKAILAELIPLAKFAKLPPDRLLRALASRYAFNLPPLP